MRSHDPRKQHKFEAVRQFWGKYTFFLLKSLWLAFQKQFEGR
jgi:hypothetical protein